jgi:hypothetical protein
VLLLLLPLELHTTVAVASSSCCGVQRTQLCRRSPLPVLLLLLLLLLCLLQARKKGFSKAPSAAAAPVPDMPAAMYDTDFAPVRTRAGAPLLL